MLDDVEKAPQRSNNDRKPHRIRTSLLVIPFLTTIGYTILASERVWQGLLSQEPQTEYTYENVIQNFGWQITCGCLALTTNLISAGVMASLVNRSWTYVRVWLLIMLPITLLAVLIGLDGATVKMDLKETVKTAGETNWAIIAIMYIMILSGDELEGKLGYVTGNRTSSRTPLSEMRWKSI